LLHISSEMSFLVLFGSLFALFAWGIIGKF
jgi:hypothetical protein